MSFRTQNSIQKFHKFHNTRSTFFRLSTLRPDNLGRFGVPLSNECARKNKNLVYNVNVLATVLRICCRGDRTFTLAAVKTNSDPGLDTAHGRRKSPLSASLWCGGEGRRGGEELVGGRRSGDHHGKLRESNHSAQEASIFGL